jgi:hypothetical protein
VRGSISMPSFQSSVGKGLKTETCGVVHSSLFCISDPKSYMVYISIQHFEKQSHPRLC